MSYIGNAPITAAFLVDTFSGTGSQTAFTMTVAPANTSSIIVAVTGVLQDPSTYSVSGTTLTFSAAPPSGTSNISVRYLGIPASGVTTTAYRTVTNTTATAGQTSFTIPSYTVGYVDVYRNGVYLPTSDYTATTGTTVVLNNAATVGDTITTVSFYVSSVLNAIQQYNGSSTNQTLTTPIANTLTSGSGSTLQLQTNGGTPAVTIDTSQRVGIGTTTTSNATLTVNNANLTSPLYIGSQSDSPTWGGFFVNGATSSTAGNGIYGKSGASLYYNCASGVNHAWTINGGEVMRLNSTGQVLIGTTSSYGSMAPTSGSITLKGVVGVSDTAMGGVVIANYSTATGLPYFAGNWASTNAWGIGSHSGSNDNIVRIAQISYAAGGLIWSGSYCNIYAGAYTNASDYRIKENVATYTGGLQAVIALRPVLYNIKASPVEDGKEKHIPKTEIGFIAHEFQESVPQLTIGTKDGMNADGTENHQAIDYAKFTAVLTSAIQELKAELDTVKAELAALKGQA